VSSADLKALGAPTSTVLPAPHAHLQNGSTAPLAHVLAPEQARVIELFKGGADVTEIVKTVYGVKGGKAYQDRSSEVNSLLRQHLA
jgi:predicted glycosyltransferase